MTKEEYKEECEIPVVETLDNNPELEKDLLEDDRWFYNKDYNCYMRRDTPKAKQPLLERVKSIFNKKKG